MLPRNLHVSHGIPALVGTVAIINCPPGLVLAGSNVTATTCMPNGRWDPAPKTAICKGEL